MKPSPPQIVATLEAKRHDIEASINAHDAKLQRAKRDLAHVQATLALFATDDPGTIRASTDTSRLFDRGEMWKLCCQALAERGPMDTRELSRWIADTKGMDSADPVLCKALAYRIVQSLTLPWKRKRIGSEGLRRNVRVWALLKAE